MSGTRSEGKLGILVGGGPAPGINSVIGAATIRCALQGVEVLGIQDGFEHVMEGDCRLVRPLTIDDVSRIHFRGGSVLGISRANPTKKTEHLVTTVKTLLDLGITQLITIGGDDTEYSAMCVADEADDRIRVAHVPKTIDNDLDLPPEIDTFGFQTARHMGAELVRNIMVDAATTSRWYFIVAMGRKAGHLALGIGKAAGATLTLIPEEFGPGKVELRRVVDTLAGAVIKRLAHGRRHGVAVIAEGVALAIKEEDLGNLEGVELDEHENVRIAEIDLGAVLKNTVRDRLHELGIKMTIVDKDIGYELRCADPVPFDLSYTRDLGFCAAEYLLDGGGGAMVSMQGGRFVPVPFDATLDETTGRARVRLVDMSSEAYRIARSYMIRVARADFDEPHELERLAAAAGISAEHCRAQFEYLCSDQPGKLHLA